MKTLQDSSEIQEASKLIADLLKPLPVPAAPAASPKPKLFAAAVQEERPLREVSLKPDAAAPAIKKIEEEAPPAEVQPDSDILVLADEESAPQFRGDKLEHALAAMCKRSGFIGAVVADNKGLPLAVYNSPVGADAIAAFTTVLGGALEKAGTLLGQHGAETISMDINYADKVVLRLFTIEGNPYFIMVLCPQNVDARSEVELSITQITAILTGS